MARTAELYEKEHKALETYFVELREITITFTNARTVYTKALYKMLESLYSLYKRVNDSEYNSAFYANLRGGLRAHGVKIQSNTSDEALLIRFVLRASKPKQVYDYSTVLAEALEQEVESSAFSKWIEETTIAGAISNYRQRISTQATYRDRLKRARLLVLRMLDIRETRPVGSFSYPTLLAERWVNRGTHLVVMIGYANRRYDRDSQTADVNILFALDPNIENDVWVINEMAKRIVTKVEMLEEKMNVLEKEVWADELYNQVVESYAVYAEERTEWWMERQQAARYEDQKEFLRGSAARKRERKQPYRKQ